MKEGDIVGYVFKGFNSPSVYVTANFLATNGIFWTSKFAFAYWRIKSIKTKQ